MPKSARSLRAWGLAAGLLLVCPVLGGRPATGEDSGLGDDSSRAEQILASWAKAAKPGVSARDWDCLLGPPLPSELNGAPELASAEPLLQASGVMEHWTRSFPQVRAMDNGLKLALEKLDPYFKRLRSVGLRPGFEPALTHEPIGNVAPGQGITLAARAQALRVGLGARDGLDGATWTLETLVKWHVRTSTEGLVWDDALLTSLLSLRQIVGGNSDGCDGDDFTRIQVLLRSVRDAVRVSHYKRVLSRRHRLYWQCSRAIAGEVPVSDVDLSVSLRRAPIEMGGDESPPRSSKVQFARDAVASCPLSMLRWLKPGILMR